MTSLVVVLASEDSAMTNGEMLTIRLRLLILILKLSLVLLPSRSNILQHKGHP